MAHFNSEKQLRLRNSNKVYQNLAIYKKYYDEIDYMRMKKLYTRKEVLEERAKLDYKFKNRT